MYELFAGYYVAEFPSETITKNIIRAMSNVSEKYLAWPFSQGYLYWSFVSFLCMDFLKIIKWYSKKILSVVISLFPIRGFNSSSTGLFPLRAIIKGIKAWPVLSFTGST